MDTAGGGFLKLRSSAISPLFNLARLDAALSRAACVSCSEDLLEEREKEFRRDIEKGPCAKKDGIPLFGKQLPKYSHLRTSRGYKGEEGIARREGSGYEKE